MSCNPGLKSRFSERLHFPDFTADDTVAMLRTLLLKEYSLEMDVEAADALPNLANQICFWCIGGAPATPVPGSNRAHAGRVSFRMEL